MKEELVTKLEDLGIKAVDFASMSAEKLLGFVQEQAPILLKDWVQWNLIVSLGLFVLGVFIFITSALYTRNTLKPFKQKDSEWGNKWFYWFDYNADLFFIGIMNMIVIVFATGFSIAAIYDGIIFIQILLFPKIWILENIKTLF